MDIIPGEVIIEPASSRPASQSQPVQALQGLDPQLDDAQVRQAIATAEANNQDPQTLTLQDLAQVPASDPIGTQSQPKPVEVPQKFLKPDGAVDVEKIQASTRQLDQAIQQKEEAVAKTVDDYMREYNERQTKFRNMPNPDRLATQLPIPPPAPPLPESNPQNFEEIVRRDYAVDPLGTTTRLFDLMLQKKFQPIEEREKAETTRANLQTLASKDPRILHPTVYAAVSKKLSEDPDLWKLKNPHKAAWLEVKEEMRLGELSPAQAQPSRTLSPVLGGGSPPSAPSSSVSSPQNVVSNLNTLDLRDKKQEAMGDEAIRQLLAGNRG